jgi:hypothetical protein
MNLLLRARFFMRILIAPLWIKRFHQGVGPDRNGSLLGLSVSPSRSKPGSCKSSQPCAEHESQQTALSRPRQQLGELQPPAESRYPPSPKHDHPARIPPVRQIVKRLGCFIDAVAVGDEFVELEAPTLVERHQAREVFARAG